MRNTPCLAEDKRLRLETDECISHSLSVNPPWDESIDWGSDPMEILMRKQELERLVLEAELSIQH
jgi:hypothetical protein